MPEGDDFYCSMRQLYANETEGTNYTKEWYRHRWRYETSKNYPDENTTCIMAPHGGGIESGTTELALATAGFTDGFNNHPAASETYDYFIFNGTNPTNQNGKLHVTASNFNDPAAIELVQRSVISLAFHGCTDEQPDESTGIGYKACLIGGRDENFKDVLEIQLTGAGFNAYKTKQESLNGDLRANIINRNKQNAGAQFELTTTFRKSLYGVNNRKDRRTSTNADFWLFVNTIRASIKQHRILLAI
ncbi:poly-gamma-glutamate hydrolase family protein [Hymenobacter volaticus]|uniref:Poly-gamma-glutamate hydrolase family protein n=1 Tax=Hymenobacter volaticus TaxID=2932254 RepID=A0ABY4G2K4_9BACT|nr:poly-gamma-glutamate hydrolase family protein [Hymenobacter volaticus]UOQ65015.1 poly-gamma-glutamate hydrolase family protein [Hymenobacter volaticus]